MIVAKCNNAIHALLIVVGFSALGLAAEEAPYCAFEVKVRKPSGEPYPKVTVVLVRNRATTFSETLTDAAGVAKLCDAPLEFMDIVVGFDICGSVMVRHLAPTWPETRHVYVTFVDAPCDHFVVRRECRVLLRVEDGKGRRLAGVRFEGKPSLGSAPHVTDTFGRLFFPLMKRESVKGVLVKQGYESAPVSVQHCDDNEVRVVLRERLGDVGK